MISEEGALEIHENYGKTRSISWYMNENVNKSKTFKCMHMKCKKNYVVATRPKLPTS